MKCRLFVVVVVVVVVVVQNRASPGFNHIAALPSLHKIDSAQPMAAVRALNSNHKNLRNVFCVGSGS
jgi:hypothetical protein